MACLMAPTPLLLPTRMHDATHISEHYAVPIAFAEQLTAKIDNKTKPLGSLGQIEQLAAQIACVQGSTSPQMDCCELTIFAADHGMANAGVSAYPQAVTRQMVLNFLEGGAASNVFCEALGIGFGVVDAGVAGEPIVHARLINKSIAAGTANAIEGAAMSTQQRDSSITHGQEIGSRSSAHAVCFGEMGIGNTSSASLLCHKILGLSLDELTGAGTGLDEAGVRAKLSLLKTASARTDKTLSALDALQEYGGFEIAMMVGAIFGAADTKKIVIVDGFIATAAALVAIGIKPAIKPNLVYAHHSAEQGHSVVLDAMNVKPLLALQLRLGEGTGALLAWPLIKSAAAMLNSMASFDGAGVSGPV